MIIIIKREEDAALATLKYSRQREEIKNFLMTRKDHPTADTIYENVRIIYPNISLGTVYRNLALLTDLGEILKIPCKDGADRFDGRTERHCHFMCTECGGVTDLENETMSHFLDEAQNSFNGKITEYNISFSGICENCLNNNL